MCWFFYSSGQVVNFALAVSFVILPSCLYLPVNFITNRYERMGLAFQQTIKLVLYSFNPFKPALSQMVVVFECLVSFNKMWYEGGGGAARGLTREEVRVRKEKLANVITFGMVETTAEAAPQLIIQIYTMVLDYENIVAIQIVSVVFSFINLTWAIINYQFHVYDNDKLLANMTPRDRLTIGVCHTFLLVSHVVVLALFTSTQGLWIIAIVGSHGIAAGIFFQIFRQIGNPEVIILFGAMSWLTWFDFSSFDDNGRKVQWVIVWIPYLWNASENIALILLFYFSSETKSLFLLFATISICFVTIASLVLKQFYSRVVLRKKLRKQRVFEEEMFNVRDNIARATRVPAADVLDQATKGTTLTQIGSRYDF